MPEVNSIIYKNILIIGMYSFFLELLAAQLIFLRNAKRRDFFLLRAAAVILIGSPLYFLKPITLFNINISYLICFAVMIICSLWLYKESVIQIIFSAVAAFSLQHLTWNTLFVVYDLIPDISEMNRWGHFSIYLSLFIISYSCAFTILKLLKIDAKFDKKTIFSFIIAVIVLFSDFLLSQLVSILDRWTLIYRIYATLLALMGILIQIGYPALLNYISRGQELESEKVFLQTLIQEQAKQQEMSTETVEIVNMKYHDLKNQLAVLKNSLDRESLEELEKEVDIYKDIAKIGNRALDIILTQKSILCSKKNIKFNYFIDTSPLKMISDMDISSLFGNIIDNALEAVEQEKEEYKVIKLNVSKINNFLSIREENYCHKELNIEEHKVVKTTKGDKNYHGFGLKSIRFIAEKYAGDMNIYLENEIFTISILIPLNASKEH